MRPSSVSTNLTHTLFPTLMYLQPSSSLYINEFTFQSVFLSRLFTLAFLINTPLLRLYTGTDESFPSPPIPSTVFSKTLNCLNISFSFFCFLRHLCKRRQFIDLLKLDNKICQLLSCSSCCQRLKQLNL